MHRLTAVLLAGAICGPSPVDAQIALTHVTVVDVAGGQLLPDQMVVVSGNRIVQVSPASESAPPAGARVVAAEGKFLIPGLWDMHAHYFGEPTPGCPEITFAVAVAHGVTGARNVAGHLDYVFAWRAEVESGRMIGPRILSAGPLIDGVPAAYPPASVVAPSPEDGRRIVDGLWRRGVDFIKAYEMLDSATFFAIVDQAKTRGLPVVAHLPLGVRAADASDAGVRSFEHLRNIDLACSSEADSLRSERIRILQDGARRNGRELRSRIHAAQRPRAIATWDWDRCRALLRKLSGNGTWQTPTLFMETRDAFRPDLRAGVRSSLRWVPATHRAAWEEWSTHTSALSAGMLAERKRRADRIVQLVREMNDARLGLLAGTDVSTEWTVPGAALHEELRALVDAGLTPLEALRTATWNPARYFEKTSEFGSVAVGRLADLVLVDADPLADIGNLRRISGVMTNGRYLDRRQLDSLSAVAERLAATAGHEMIHPPPPARHPRASPSK